MDFKAPLSSKRMELRNEVPLKQPLKICIDPADLCNFKCDFCGLHSGRGKLFKGNIMPVDMFHTVVGQIKEFDEPIEQIHLYALGEPMINPNLVHFVKYLKAQGAARSVIIVSNGSLLSPPLSDSLIAAGLDELRISLNGLSDEDYKQITGVNISFDKIRTNISYYFHAGGRIHVKILGDYFTEQEKERFYDLFKDCSTSLNITNAIQNLEGQQFNIELSGRNQHGLDYYVEEKMVCPQMFYEMVIHANGDIGPCSADYEFFCDSLGNVTGTTLRKVWEGRKLHEMRVAALCGTSVGYGNCDKCNFAKAGATVNITPYKEEILERVQRQWITSI